MRDPLDSRGRRSGAIIEMLESRQLLSTYYVASSGRDSASGATPGAAWHSVARVNKQILKAGDRVLFQGGRTFGGTLSLNSHEGGTASRPIVFSSFGSGRATINSGGNTGFDIAETGGVYISNLNFTGSGMYRSHSSGIYVHADWNNKIVSSIHIKNVTVSGYGREGIFFLASGRNSAINDVRVEYTDSHDNLYAGLKAHNNKISGMKNYVVDHVRAWNNPGTMKSHDVTGSGIMIEGVAGATISRSIAHDNGKDGRAPVGIWAAMGERITIQYCESYNNKTATISDGGGFDFDWDVKNSVMQYNYAHNNHGPGFLLGAGYHTSIGNVIRYNVSENDGRKNGKSGIQIWGNVKDALIHNNTVFFSPSGNDSSAAFIAHDSGSNGKEPSNVAVRNNIFYTSGGAKVVHVTSGVAKNRGLKFTGNNYYSGTGKFRIHYGNSLFASLNAWRSTGQEKVKHKAVGYQTNPRLMGAGKGGTLGNADKLDQLWQYRISRKSKMINRGLTVPNFLAAITHDFFGEHTPRGRRDIGADEVR